MNTTKSRNILAISLMAAGLAFFTLSNVTSAQAHKSSCCGDGMGKDAMAMNETSGDSTKKMDMKHDMHKDGKMDKQKSASSVSIVREGMIDLKAIDKNKDGKVFQCPMDWNVISDASGKCPTCKMKLKEVSLKDAKKNLQDNGYKVK
ncbi:MAG: heavy metal-binding domain-containing protein [Ignavibacteria bacterium]|nr:heavy metal-binding domain-containing protein [Ignavibacteria bacterium]